MGIPIIFIAGAAILRGKGRRPGAVAGARSRKPADPA